MRADSGLLGELMLTSIVDDVRHSARALLARPGFTVAVIVTLALGIGGNTAVFSAIEGLLLRPLPFAQSDRLVAIYNTYPKEGQEDAGTTVADYLDRREQADALVDSAIYYDYSFDLSDQGTPQRLNGVVATPSLFTTLGVNAQLGRTFNQDDTVPDGNAGVMWVSGQRVVLLSDALWRSAFNADPMIVGRDVRISGKAYRVIGVMPRTFAFPRRDVKLWLPFAFSDKQKSDAMRGFEFGHSIGRLRPEATIAQLDAQLDSIVERNLDRSPGGASPAAADFWGRARTSGFTGRARSLHEVLVGDVGSTLWLLQVAVALLLAIACANVANLTSIRLVARRRELAMRAALGATLGRIVLQLTVESMALAIAGGIVGIAVAQGCIKLIQILGLDGGAQGFTIGLNLSVLAFALASTLVTGMTLGLVPVIALRRGPSWDALKEAARGGLGSRSAHATRSALVVVQLGLAIALLVGAGLLMRSFWLLQQQDPGFESDKLISVSLNLSRDRYRDAAQTRQFQERLLASVRALPGVKSAGLISGMPFTSDNDTNPYVVEGRESGTDSAYMQSVDEGLFPTMGIPLLQGRNFLASDDERGAPVVIVDDELARKAFGDGSPLGRRIATRGVNGLEWRTIVGVVASIKRHRLSEAAGAATFYAPSRQSTTRIFRIAIRSDVDIEAMAGPLRAATAEIDPDQPIWDVLTMRERISRSLDERRTPMLLLMLFAGVALGLSGIGIYGVLAFAVAQRTGEIGVRMSLGADRARVVSMVLLDGGRLVVIGVLLGAALAFALGWQLRGELFGIDLVDPIALAAVLILVVAIALFASLIPAIRAANTSPTEALRYE